MSDKIPSTSRSKVRPLKLPAHAVTRIPGLIGSMKPRKLLRLIDKIEAIPDTPERQAFYDELEREFDGKG